MITRRGALALSGAWLAATSQSASGQSKYPERPIRLVVPYAPGGVFDAIGRPWADKMGPLLGNIVVENITGGGGALGAAAVARAAPDGYSILIGASSIHFVELLKTKPLFDPLQTLDTICVLGNASYAIAVHPTVPARTLKELAELAKSNPGKFSYGTAGAASMNHLAGELLKSLTGADMPHVPYRGAGPAITDALGGHIPVLIPAVTAQVLDLHRTGKLRVLAITSPKRLEVASDIPTTSEAGYAVVAQTQMGLFAPAGTAAEIKLRVAEATAKAVADADFRKRFDDAGIEIDMKTTAEGFRTFVAAEVAKWGPIVKAANITL